MVMVDTDNTHTDDGQTLGSLISSLTCKPLKLSDQGAAMEKI